MSLAEEICHDREPWNVHGHAKRKNRSSLTSSDLAVFAMGRVRHRGSRPSTLDYSLLVKADYMPTVMFEPGRVGRTYERHHSSNWPTLWSDRETVLPSTSDFTPRDHLQIRNDRPKYKQNQATIAFALINTIMVASIALAALQLIGALTAAALLDIQSSVISAILGAGFAALGFALGRSSWKLRRLQARHV